MQFSFFEPVYYLDSDQSYPHSKELGGRYLGIADSVGDAMTYIILTSTNKTIARSVLRSALDENNINFRANFPNQIREDNLDCNNQHPFQSEKEIFNSQNIHHLWEDDAHQTEWTKVSKNNEPDQVLQSTTDLIGEKPKPIINPEELIGYKFIAKHKGIDEQATIRKWNAEDGKFIIEFLSGGEELMVYNDIINYYNKNEEESAELYSFQKIIGHRRERGVYELQILWSNNEITWEPMLSIKTSDPLTVAKYAHDKQLYNLKGWKWCKKYHRNPNRFIRAVRAFKAKVKRLFKKYKFGVEIPTSIKHALVLDQQNGNSLWLDAINKEVNELLEHDTFKILDNAKELSKEYQFIPSHFVLDCKFDGRRKARLVAGGNWTDPDEADIYSGVVSIEAVRLLFFIADLNGLLIIAADVSNAYLHGKTNEKVYTKIDFGKLSGKTLVIEKAQYGLKTSAARWHEACSVVLLKMKFIPSLADSDLWMRKTAYGYEYIAVYVDDLIVASKEPMKAMDEFKQIGGFKLKGVGEPEYYLGGDVEREKRNDKSEKYITKISARTYIKNVCDKIERVFNLTLKNYHSPLEGGYHPELDTSELLDEVGISQYRMLIGSMNWAVTLGRFDIMFAAITMARYSSIPREGHLKVCIRIFGYLKYHSKAAIRFNVNPIELPGDDDEVQKDWTQLYPNSTDESIKVETPVSVGPKVRTWIMVDADHAHDLETRRSVSGILFFINGTLIKWYSKRQATVETSTYGSEIVAMKIAVEIAHEMRYKLKMLGVRVEGPTIVYGDNRSVVLNGSKPESTLKKKHHLCSVHYIRQASASSVVSLRSISSKKNISDCMTKALPPHLLHNLVKPILFSKDDNDITSHMLGES